MQALSVLLGQRIKEIRKAKNIKQVKLAEMIDIEATNLSKIEKGLHLPKDETINKILEALDIGISDLFDFSHLTTQNELIHKINKIISEASFTDLQFIYRILVSYMEIRK